jgi:hypothetical protein
MIAHAGPHAGMLGPGSCSAHHLCRRPRRCFCVPLHGLALADMYFAG